MPPRTPLGIINGNRQYNKELTSYERGKSLVPVTPALYSHLPQIYLNVTQLQLDLPFYSTLNALMAILNLEKVDWGFMTFGSSAAFYV
jgi:hypothetical protein